MNYEMSFSALLGSSPLGALASFGLLRKITDWDASAQLMFSMRDDWVAVVRCHALRDASEIVDRLSEWISSDIFDRLLNWPDDVRISPAEFRRRLACAVADDDRLMIDFLTAIATDGAVDAQKGLIKPSAFYMVSGQQSFIGGMRDIVAKVRDNPRHWFTEALIGPWRYEMQSHSLGWDPGTERLHALRHRAPTGEKPVCIGGAVLLAFWALPLFPTVAANQRAVTTGFTRSRGEQHFHWPIWSTPIGLDELRTLMHTGKSAWFSQTGGRLRDGIQGVYRSRRSEFGQGYAIFRSPEVIATDNAG